MLNTASKNINIAVFRGGKNNHGASMKSGQNIISLLARNGINVNDVYLDDEGNFIKNGLSADRHQILMNLDGYIDTTDHHNLSHHDLASRMGLKNIISHKESIPVQVDREGIYRILRQSGVNVPKTFIIRKTENNLLHTAKEVWTKFHTPLLLRPLEYTSSRGSVLVKSFQDLIKSVSEYHQHGNDVHILSYKSVPTFATAVVPNYRGEDYYTPLSVQTFVKKHEVPNRDSVVQVYIKAEDDKKEKIKKLTKEVSRVLQISGPVCIDVIPYKDDYMVVNVDLSPSLHDDSRFMQSLASTGVDLGNFIIKQIANSKQNEKHE